MFPEQQKLWKTWTNVICKLKFYAKTVLCQSWGLLICESLLNAFWGLWEWMERVYISLKESGARQELEPWMEPRSSCSVVLTWTRTWQCLELGSSGGGGAGFFRRWRSWVLPEVEAYMTLPFIGAGGWVGTVLMIVWEIFTFKIKGADTFILQMRKWGLNMLSDLSKITKLASVRGWIHKRFV